MTQKKKDYKIIEEQEASMPIIPDRPSEGIVRDAQSVIEKKDPKTELQAKALLEMTQSEGWGLFKEYLRRRGSRMQMMTREAVRKKGFNFADAGYAFILYDQLSSADEAAIAFAEGPTKLKAFEQEEPDDAAEADEL